MILRLLQLIFLVALAGGVATPAFAQEATEVEEVVVVARRSGVPIWEVKRGDNVLILVGDLNGVPRDLDWGVRALEDATGRSQRILLSPVARTSGGDLLRLLWRARTVALLPAGVTHADYLDTATFARLEDVMAEENPSWRRTSPVGLGFELLNEGAGYKPGGRNARDVVAQAARRADLPARSIGFVRGDEIIESLISTPPAAYASCIRAAVAAAEIGPGAFAARAESWRRIRVPEVIASPLDVAVFQCWPYGDPSIGPQLKALWIEAINGSLDETGVTMAVAPLRLLAEPGGVLDDLEAQGFEISGPRWKAE